MSVFVETGVEGLGKNLLRHDTWWKHWNLK